MKKYIYNFTSFKIASDLVFLTTLNVFGRGLIYVIDWLNQSVLIHVFTVCMGTLCHYCYSDHSLHTYNTQDLIDIQPC